jgi:hypothetical protein
MWKFLTGILFPEQKLVLIQSYKISKKKEEQNREFTHVFLIFGCFSSDKFWLLTCKFSSDRCCEDFEILRGDLQGLTDTMAFLKSLSGLSGNASKNAEVQSRERTAASVLFDWEVLIFQSFLLFL